MANNAVNVDTEHIFAPKRRGFFADFFFRLFKEKPLGAIGFAICLIFILTAFFADFIAPFGYNEMNPIDRLQGPSMKYIFGTDNIGRDLFSRIVYGARLSVIIGFAATLLSVLISILIGVTTGFFGGKYDLVVQRFVDGWMCFPGLVILIVMVSITGPGVIPIIFILSLQFGIAGSRIVRGATVATRENMYIRAADALGASTARILVRHILPNIMAPIIILFTTRVAAVILSEASLSFLGLGVPPPAPSWGGMLSGAGRAYMRQAPLLALVPGLCLTIVVYGINIFGDAMRDLLDPRLRGGGGRYNV